MTKKISQRPAGRILGLKSKTDLPRFLTQTIPASLLNSSMNARCCTVNRVEAACDTQHDVRRLLTVHGAASAEVRRAPTGTKSTAVYADSESTQQQERDPEHYDTVQAGSIYAPQLSAVPSSSRYASTARRRGSTTTLMVRNPLPP